MPYANGRQVQVGDMILVNTPQLKFIGVVMSLADDTQGLVVPLSAASTVAPFASALHIDDAFVPSASVATYAANTLTLAAAPSATPVGNAPASPTS
jgi:hypothetical protein